MTTWDWALGLVTVGGLNWATVGLFEVDLVQLALGGRTKYQASILSRAVYILVGASAVYLLASSGKEAVEESSKYQDRVHTSSEAVNPLN
jgi:hypothetical protein